MKIGLDLRMLGGGSGISRYVQELSTQILSHDKRNSYVLFFYQITPEIDRLYRPFGQTMVATGIRHYGFAEQIKFPFVLYKHNLDLVHFPHFNVPILYLRPFVLTIHDLTHTRFPGRKKSNFIFRLGYNLILANAVNRAKKIITVSNSTRTELVDHFSRLNSAKVATIYEGVSKGYEMMHKDSAFEHVSKKYDIAKPYILYVGVWRRYKNLPMLAQAFDRLSQKFDYQLALVGEPDPHYPEIKDEVLGIKNAGKIKALGRVEEKDLLHLYNAADLLVLPSFYEGFGLTPLEAAACGTPVACSDIPALREVMGQAAEYFDPQNLENMIDVIGALLENPLRREELANLGLKRVGHFSWKKAAEETSAVYESALK
jgi:glycosyltransferase involved in cell wall biosynthesis